MKINFASTSCRWKSTSCKWKSTSWCKESSPHQVQVVWMHLGLDLPKLFQGRVGIGSLEPFRKSLQKKRPPYSKTGDYRRVRWLPETPHRVRTSQTRNKSSSSKCCSNSCPWLWFRKIGRKWLFELASIANVSKQNRKNEKGRCQKHITCDLTRPGQRPGE